MDKFVILSTLTGLILSLTCRGQELLTKELAIQIALENNFDIRAAKNNLEISRNSALITNSDYLPTISGIGGANFATTNSQNTTQANDVISLTGVETSRYNAGINLDYTLFSGFSRKYNYQKLQENYNLTDLQARNVMENTLFNIFNSYYQIARLTQNQLNQSQSLTISKERLIKAQYAFEYGQKTQLDVLNAEVDYNNDSINFLNISQSLTTEKNNLNLLLGRSIQMDFKVDTTLQFTETLGLEELLSNALINNVDLLQQSGNVRNASANVKISNAAIIPRVGLSSNYTWQNNDFGPAGFFASQQSNGLNIGASLSWNIWDGGKSNTNRQNTQIQLENQEISLSQLKLNLERNISNAWTLYQTALFVTIAQRKNLETNQRNFDRTKEQYLLGQINSIFFRQAQLNLLNAQVNYNQSRYSAKTAELGLLQLSGDLLQSEL
ncbi:MAG: TolC family protein [Flammeovirgaceae bacterium]|nr:TolC family protein [Flammeovirgaceae bacterium]|tara:strand:+ start:42280 stop:43599 length:1320 start_codon:yes stop_codon:yes gene_type:complete